MKYVMLIVQTEKSDAMTPEEGKAFSAEVMGWYEKHAGTAALPDTGYQLQPTNTAKTIRGGVVTDGPFIESKEVLGGYSVIEADTAAEAVELAKSWPGVASGLYTIELRPVVVF
ncbi:MAG TPA: YciI family protein [Streptosporangiaceae bacterium]|jgi:hypothetical protein